jgi:hypothetical protein
MIMMSFIKGGTRNPSPTSFHHEIGSLLYMKFEVDMGEWTTSRRFNQKAHEYLTMCSAIYQAGRKSD